MKTATSAAMKLLALFAGFGLAGQLWAAPSCPGTTLPAPTASNSVTFGDAVVFALPLLGIDVQSSPGQISDCIVVMTGASGGPVNTNFAGMDNAYATPSGTGGSPYMRTGDPANSPDPGQVGGPFAGDSATSWDIQLSALSSYLQGGQMVVYFNHNQTNSGSTIDQNLFIWAQLALVDLQGVLPTQYFYLTSIPNTTGLSNFGAPGFNPTGYTGPLNPSCPAPPTKNTYPTGSDAVNTFPQGGVGTGGGNCDANFFVLARGQVCLNAANQPQPCDGTQVSTINNNLGADQVAYAVTFPEIQAILSQANFGGYDVLQADIRMGCNASTIATAEVCPPGSVLNNGYEQAFIGVAQTIIIVSEPASLALIGLALVAIGAFRPRRRAA